jgi:hypothetical protein
MTDFKEEDVKKPSAVARRGLVHAFKASTNSAKRTRIAKAIVDERISQVDKGQLSASAKKKKAKRDDRLAELNDVSVEPGFPTSFLESNNVFFETMQDDDILDELVESLPGTSKRIHLYEHMRVIDDPEGSKLMETKQIPVFIHMPRKLVLTHTGSAHADVQCLRNLLRKHNKVATRGTKRNGVALKYATLGAHAQRGRPGVSVKKIHKCCQRDYKHLQKMLRQKEFLAKHSLSFGLLSTIRNIKERVGDNVCLHDSSKAEDWSIWASVATSYNYVSPSHTDEDAFLTCLTVSFIPHDNNNQKFMYGPEMPVAVYFCFPEYKVTVGLRPGYVLFFNPLHHHCVSQKSEDYK